MVESAYEIAPAGTEVTPPELVIERIVSN